MSVQRVATHLGDLFKPLSTWSIIVEGMKSAIKPIASREELCARSSSAGLNPKQQYVVTKLAQSPVYIKLDRNQIDHRFSAVHICLNFIDGLGV